MKRHSNSGFTLVETMVTVGIVAVILGGAIVAFNRTLPILRADSALQLLQSQLLQAREAAVDQRRVVQVTFKGTQEIVNTRQELGGGTTVLIDNILNNGFTYIVFGTVPDLPAPDNYGKTLSVNFIANGVQLCSTLPCSIYFYSDGSVQDNLGNYANGTVFIGFNGNSTTARAVTILGATGRIHAYNWSGKAWF